MVKNSMTHEIKEFYLQDPNLLNNKEIVDLLYKGYKLNIRNGIASLIKIGVDPLYLHSFGPNNFSFDSQK